MLAVALTCKPFSRLVLEARRRTPVTFKNRKKHVKYSLVPVPLPTSVEAVYKWWSEKIRAVHWIDFASAAEKGDLTFLQDHAELLQHSNSYGDLMLNKAIKAGRKKVVEYLLSLPVSWDNSSLQSTQL